MKPNLPAIAILFNLGTVACSQGYKDCSYPSTVDRVALSEDGAWVTGYQGGFGGCPEEVERKEIVLTVDGEVSSDSYSWVLEGSPPTPPTGYEVVYRGATLDCETCSVLVTSDDYSQSVTIVISESEEAFVVELNGEDGTVLAEGEI